MFFHLLLFRSESIDIEANALEAPRQTLRHCREREEVRLEEIIPQAFAKNKAEIEALLSKPTEVKLAGEGETLSDWRKTFFTVQVLLLWCFCTMSSHA